MLLQECPVDVVKQATLGKWYDEYGPKLLAMLRQRLDRRPGARRDAEDVLHDVFLRAEHRWDDYPRSGMTPYPWLYRLAFDCVCDDHDQQHRHCRNIDKEEAWPEQTSRQFVRGLADPGTSIGKAVARDEVLRVLRERMIDALAQLSAADRDLLCMRHYDGLKLKEIAHVLGLAEGTVRVRYARARLRLRDVWLERYGEQESSA